MVCRVPEPAEPAVRQGLQRQVRRHACRHQRRLGRGVLGRRDARGRGQREQEPVQPEGHLVPAQRCDGADRAGAREVQRPRRERRGRALHLPVAAWSSVRSGAPHGCVRLSADRQPEATLGPGLSTGGAWSAPARSTHHFVIPALRWQARRGRQMRRPPARTFALVAMIAASAAVAACGLSSANNNTLLAGPSGQPITVGISEPLKGPAQAQGFAADGQACLKGYELWASDVNSHGGLLGRPVKLVVMNDEGWPKSTTYDYNWLITHDHVDLTLGPFSSLLNAQAAGPVTKSLHYVLPAGQAGAPSVYQLNDPYMFSTNVPVAIQMVPFAKWVLGLPPGQRPTSAAYPIVNNPFSIPPVWHTKSTLERAGIKTVYLPPGKYPNIGYNNLSPAALRADARAVAKSNAQMVVLGSVDVPTVEAFIKEFAAAGYHPKIFIAAA